MFVIEKMQRDWKMQQIQKSKNGNELGASLSSGILGLGSHFTWYSQLFLVSWNYNSVQINFD